MGKHKHRRRDDMEGYMQEPMNNGYMGGYNNGPMNANPQMNMNPQMNNMGQMNMNGQNPMAGNPMAGSPMAGNSMGGSPQQGNMSMNNGMNPMGMNPGQSGMNNPLASLFGGGDGNLNGIMQLLGTLGLGGDMQQGQGGGDLMGMINFLMNSLGGQQGSQQNGEGENNNQNQNNSKNQNGTNSTIEELLSRIGPQDIEELQRVINNMQNNNTEEKKSEESIEDVLASLNFNAILDNLNSGNVDFTNVDIGDLDVDDIIKNDDFEEEGEVTTVEDEDIIEENIFSSEKKLTEDEYIKLVNILLKLIDEKKIKLLQKIVDEYGKSKKV